MLDKSEKFAKKRKRSNVEVPDMGTVTIQELSVVQLEKIGKGEAGLPQQLAWSIVDENGSQIYSSKEDLENLAEMPARISRLIFNEVNKLNGWTTEGQEETLKN